MKPLILSLALALVSTAACVSADAHRTTGGAQTSTYYSVGGERGDADLQAAARVCDSPFGIVHNGSNTPDGYRQCMLAQGWEYGFTTRDDAYPDPWHPGLACRDFVIFGIVGSSCSNF